MAYLGNSPANALFNLSPPVTLTAGQTAVTINYTPGRTLFLLNGSVLTLNDDITATNGSTATLATPATAGDQLVAINFASFAVANALPLSGGVMGGPVSHAGGDTGVTPAQFDFSTKLATTGFVTSNGLRFPQANGMLMNANAAIPLSFIGGWGQFAAAGVTMTLPALSTVPVGASFTALGGAYGGTIAANGADTIQSSVGINASTAGLISGQQVTFVSNGAGNGWYMAACGLGIGAFGSSLAGSGWQKLPSGLILQWGAVSGVPQAGTLAVTFPLAFPNTPFAVSLTGAQSAGTSAGWNLGSANPTKTGFIAANNGANGALSGWYIAIGD